MKLSLLAFIILNCLSIIKNVDNCTAFYCINSCGSSSNQKGYKLILANNRDEDIYRLTIPAAKWMQPTFKNTSTVFGPLDFEDGRPPNYYSTWIGVNEYGRVANLLFFVKGNNRPIKYELPRGKIASDYLFQRQLNTKDYLNELDQDKFNYLGFNYVILQKSPKTNNYSLYYVNNNDTKPFRQMNPDEKNMFQFGLSNSDPDRPFQKVVAGEIEFANIIKDYSKGLSTKDGLVKVSILNI
jgi:uncharacterized protein with NRDE domain